jgi:hypothetical protein
MTVTPTVAAASSSAAAAQAAAGSEVAPAAESVEGSELRGGWIIPLIALIAIILGLCAATDQCFGDDDDDLPKSP